MGWKDYFEVTDRAPVKLVLPSRKVVDFRIDTPDIETMTDIFESGLPYLKLKPKGALELYGIKPEKPAETKAIKKKPIKKKAE